MAAPILPILGIGGALAYYLMKDSEPAKVAKMPVQGAARPQVPSILNNVQPNQPGYTVTPASTAVQQTATSLAKKNVGLKSEIASRPLITQAAVNLVATAGRIVPNKGETKLADPPKVVAKTAGGNPVVSIMPINPDNGTETTMHQLTTAGIAAEPARALYDYLKDNGISPTPELSSLCLALQRAHNSDETSLKVAGRLQEDGVYELSTSAVLTNYTGQPIPPNRNLPVYIEKYRQGPACMTATNLYAYLKTHERPKSPTAASAADPVLKELVWQFQHAVNTDKLFPGPVFELEGVKYPKAAVVKEKLSEDGVFGQKTSDALAVATMDRIKP